MASVPIPKHINKLTLKHFWQASLADRKQLYLVSVFIPLNAFCLSTLVPFYIGKILANLGHATAISQHYVPYLVLFVVIGILANYIGFRAYMKFQADVMRKLETEALETLLKRSVGFHNNNIAGKLVSDATEYPHAYQQLTNIFFTTIIPIVVALVTGIIVVFINSLLLGWLVIAMTVGVVGVGVWQTMRSTPQRNERHAARRAVIAQQADAITNSVTVKTFAKENEELAQSKKLSRTLANHRIRDWGQQAADGTLRIGSMLAFEIIYVLLIIHLVKRDPALLAIGIFTFTYVINLTNRLFDIGTIFRTIEDSLLEASDIMGILSTEPEIVDAPDAITLAVTQGAVQLQHVAFRYQDAQSDEYVFKELDLAIAPGEKVGLVGPSGGGKSTLSRLLLRFDNIQAGAIIIDGENIAQVTQKSLRENIAYVPQEPLLFHRSIFTNIAYGKPQATLDEVRAAAEKAYALDFVEKLPKDFETIVGERGVKLSGGQRQRIAIARAMLKNAPILVLDEATSALDSESEALIQQALWKLMEDRTAIVIAHRLSTIQRMDRIIVLDNGEIVEEGNHKELVGKQNGLYAKLWSHQSGGFIEE